MEGKEYSSEEIVVDKPEKNIVEDKNTCPPCPPGVPGADQIHVWQGSPLTEILKEIEAGMAQEMAYNLGAKLLVDNKGPRQLIFPDNKELKK